MNEEKMLMAELIAVLVFDFVLLCTALYRRNYGWKFRHVDCNPCR